MRSGTPRVRPVVQVTGDLAGEDKVRSAEIAKQQTLRWVQRRVGVLPGNAWSFVEFEHFVPGRSAISVSLKNGDDDCWIIRCENPDLEIPDRNWITEISVALENNQALFGIGLSVASGNDLGEFKLHVPGIVRQVAEEPGLLREARQISVDPLIVQDVAGLDDLIDLIEAPNRRRPVYVISLEESQIDPATAVVAPNRLAERCVGIAHVAVVPGHLTFELTDRFGKEFSVFRGAVRTYRPDFSFAEDSPFSHPLALANTIREWEYGGPEGFVDFLTHQAARESLTRISPDRDFPSFSTVKQRSLELRRRKIQEIGNSDADLLLKIALEESEQKDNQIKNWEEIAYDEEEKRKKVEEQLHISRGHISWMSERIIVLEKKISQFTGEGIDKDIPILDTMDKVGNWATEYLQGRIELTKRSLRSAKNSKFKDVPLIYRSLLALAMEYRDMRIDGDRSAFDNKLDELGVECANTISNTKAGEQGDEYYVQIGRSKRLLDKHLKYGVSRDERLCMRIYFLWDEERKLVVVGSFPAHLRTRIS